MAEEKNGKAKPKKTRTAKPGVYIVPAEDVLKYWKEQAADNRRHVKDEIGLFVDEQTRRLLQKASSGAAGSGAATAAPKPPGSV